MRIAQIVPLMGKVAPDSPFGLGRDVYALTEELVRQGHQVTLFATGDSQTSAELVSVRETALESQVTERWLMYHTVNLEQAFKRAERFDIIHNHMELFAAPMARRSATPTLSTLPELIRRQAEPLFAEYRELPLAAVSHYQQQQAFPWLNWRGVVYRGIPLDDYPFQPEPGDYLACYGAVTPDAGIPAAIELAQRSGLPLKIALSDPFQYKASYFAELSEQLAQPGVEYLGQLGQHEIAAFLGAARALLHPTERQEVFNLGLVEALACGTPVIATRRGAAPEIVAEGLTGFLFEQPDQALAAIAQLDTISRSGCRASVAERFTTAHMAAGYLQIYQHLLGSAPDMRRGAHAVHN